MHIRLLQLNVVAVILSLIILHEGVCGSGVAVVDEQATAAAADTCSSQQGCSQCLAQAADGCRWCYEGGAAPNVHSHCQSSSEACQGFHQRGPEECPSDSFNDHSAFSCGDLGSCTECLRYGGTGTQCRWCLGSKGGPPFCQGSKNLGHCSEWLTDGITECAAAPPTSPEPTSPEPTSKSAPSTAPPPPAPASSTSRFSAAAQAGIGASCLLGVAVLVFILCTTGSKKGHLRYGRA